MKLRIWKGIMNQQYVLTYYGHFTWSDTESMIPYEREYLYNRLSDTKERERKHSESRNSK